MYIGPHSRRFIDRSLQIGGSEIHNGTTSTGVAPVISWMKSEFRAARTKPPELTFFIDHFEWHTE